MAFVSGAHRVSGIVGAMVSQSVRHHIVYSNGVHRSQIYLDDVEVALLNEAAGRTGASRSELLRRAVRAQYGTSAPERRLTALRASAGIWRGRTGTGADYVDEVRADLTERLEQVGLG